MRNFELYVPTKIIFGKGQIEKLTTEVPKDKKVLLLYGGGSIKKNGVYDQVIAALKDHNIIEFSGIEANPEYTTLLKALEIIKKEDIGYMLAVGGGSVIDGTKFLSSAAVYEGDSPWDILAKRIRTLKGLPFGTVLTLPATGSEMNSGAVVSRSETNEKMVMGGPGLFPEFSICDPTVVHSIPKRQLANGIVDAYTHVLEQYMTYPADAPLQDRFSEGILQTLIEIAPAIIKDPSDYKAASNFMWCCTMALNGYIQKGVPTDWSVHMIAHELTAFYGIDHARTLAVILPSAYTKKFEQKKEKLAQYAERIFNIKEGNTEEKAREAIKRTESFFQSLDIDTRLRDYTDDYDGFSQKVAKNLTDHGMTALGEHQDITPDVAAEIVEMAY
ncbi:iron-containing alcohol dehydrogenase [Aquimarina sp. BL5]|uniref:iron-containing alcohol dehydrogenase n=1 Tax=Aquimarina sp. BL5 TaxID=1714860 RepID=UPI000E4879DB|nr:iron-containing alcohol dehydrogenase [Aquimarina sp. BL5]AXT49732.1 iron-containing alcohol dehydrogenase [Aquimarina sp. BL5]RKM93844.1 iron-containing alcohol dehydrogenase [Aquimarina sp. BL5]